MLLLATKLIKEIPDPCNAKEHYQSFIKNKNTGSVNKSKIINQLVVSQVGFNSSLYIDTEKKILTKKM